jgi:hypothetical protein
MLIASIRMSSNSHCKITIREKKKKKKKKQILTEPVKEEPTMVPFLN